MDLGHLERRCSAVGSVGPICPLIDGSSAFLSSFFFFQAEDGIRDDLVTGVQTCALPICTATVRRFCEQRLLEEILALEPDNLFILQKRLTVAVRRGDRKAIRETMAQLNKIGRASCRERV